MTEKIKLTYQLCKYGFQRKVEFASMAIMFVVGLCLDIFSHGTYWLGIFFIMMAPVFISQTLYSLCMSDLVMASQRAKQIQTSLACFADFLVTLVSVSLVVLLKTVEVNNYPEDKENILRAFSCICIMMIFIHIYMAVVFKYYALSIVLLLLIVYPSSFVMGYQSGRGAYFAVNFMPTSLGTVILLAYASALIGVGLECLIVRLLYRVPISKYAQGMTLRKYMKH